MALKYFLPRLNNDNEEIFRCCEVDSEVSDLKM